MPVALKWLYKGEQLTARQLMKHSTNGICQTALYQRLIRPQIWSIEEAITAEVRPRLSGTSGGAVNKPRLRARSHAVTGGTFKTLKFNIRVGATQNMWMPIRHNLPYQTY